MSGCPDCQKRSRWWLWIIPAILIAVGLLQLVQCEGEPGAPTGTGANVVREIQASADHAPYRRPR